MACRARGLRAQGTRYQLEPVQAGGSFWVDLRMAPLGESVVKAVGQVSGLGRIASDDLIEAGLC